MGYLKEVVITSFRGWINHKSINDNQQEWVNSWRYNSKSAQENNNTLIVFEIPNKKNGNINYDSIREIQELISKYES